LNNIVEQIENIIGTNCPQSLLTLFFDNEIRKIFPVRFHFPHVKWVLEIQYLLCGKNGLTTDYLDKENEQLAVAVSSDGNLLLVDLKSERFEILQKEDGCEIDSLGICIHDLVYAFENNQYTLIRDSDKTRRAKMRIAKKRSRRR
jgi:hypothetical protein